MMLKPFTKTFFCLLSCLFFCIKNHAQTIVIKTNYTSLIFHVDEKKPIAAGLHRQIIFQIPQTMHRLKTILIPAFPTGGMNYTREPAIEAQHTDGNISLQLNYVDYATEKLSDDVSTTEINLKDPVYPFYTTLHFKCFNKENVIEAWTTIHHDEKNFITLLRYASSFISLDYSKFYITHFYGDYAAEMQPEEIKLPEGLYNIQSKLGGGRNTYYEFPSFMISPNNPSTETDGNVLAGTFAWSSNFNLQFQNIHANGHDGSNLKIIA